MLHLKHLRVIVAAILLLGISAVAFPKTGLAATVKQNTLSINDVSLAEGNTGGTNFTFTVSLQRASNSTVTVNWAALDGSATSAGGDYINASGLLVFTSRQTSKTVTVVANGDYTPEANESFTLQLSNSVNASIADGSGQGMIVNDDVMPSFSIDDVTLAEGDSGSSNFVFTVTRSPSGVGTSSTVDFQVVGGTATAGSDFLPISGTLFFGPFDNTKLIAVNVYGDVDVEANETFYVNLSSPTNATIADGTGQGLIQNDDVLSQLSIDDVSASEGSTPGTTLFQFTVTRTNNTNSAVSVDFTTYDGTAAAGSDYAFATGTLVFGPGDTSKTIDVAVYKDFDPEDAETFFVILSNASNATITKGTGQGTILNDDTVPTVSINDVAIVEGTGGPTTSLIFTVTRSGNTNTASSVDFVTANGTASAGSDYFTALGTLVFDPGDTSKTITVKVITDNVSEATEDLFVNLFNAVNVVISDGSGVGAIINDD